MKFNRFFNDLPDSITKHSKTDLKNMLKSLFNDRSELVSMGKDSRKMYEESFSTKQMIEKTLDVYKELLGE